MRAIYLIYSVAVRGGEAQEGTLSVEVVKGDTLSDVADKLEAAGAIKSAFVFKLQARFEGYGTQIQTGRYTCQRGQDTDVIFHKLAAGRAVPTLAVTIPEVLTLVETAKAVAKDSGVCAAQFERVARRTDYDCAFLEHPGIKTTEGYVFPAKYDFEKGVTAP